MNLKWGNVQLPGFVKNSSIDQLYHYHAALGPTCHSKSGRKEEQERKKEEREREEGEMLIAKEWDHQWWLLGVYWIIDVMTWRSRSNHCHPKLSPLSFTMKKAKKKKKMKGKNRWWVVSKTVVYVLVLNCRTVYCKLSADLIIQIKQLGSTDV